MTSPLVDWLLDSDPSIRWQVMRDLTDSSREIVTAERSRVANEGWVRKLLDAQRAGRPPRLRDCVWIIVDDFERSREGSSRVTRASTRRSRSFASGGNVMGAGCSTSDIATRCTRKSQATSARRAAGSRYERFACSIGLADASQAERRRPVRIRVEFSR